MTDASPWDSHGFATRAIHAGQDPEPRTGAVAVPVFQTSTYAQAGVGEAYGDAGNLEYARTNNPTRAALETALASLERGTHGVAFSSGMAAEDAVLRATASPGDHVVLAADVYGGTYRLLKRVYEPWGLTFTTADLTDPAALESAWTTATRVVWVETPSNPLLRIADLSAIGQLARERGATVAVDNTFATPYLQQPLTHGADVVVHSTTKYLGGHSDVVGGAAVTADDALAERLRFLQNAVGAVPGPWDAWLTLRGVKTLAVRMQAHCRNARIIAEALAAHPAVREVAWPGLLDHPGHDVAAKQMRDFGGMVAFRVRDRASALEVCARFRVFTLGESLGGVESLVEHPGAMTHASTADSPIAVPDDLIRLSVGIEDAEDLVADLEQALG